MRCVLGESSTDEAECSKKVECMRRVADGIRSLVNARSLQLECSRVLDESLLVPILRYSSDTMIWREKERTRIRAVQMDNFRCLLGIRRMGKIPKAWIRELYGVTKGDDERIAKRVYVGERAGSRSVGRPRKRFGCQASKDSVPR